jgi:mono/diheme cytochrome c family protein
MGDACRVKGDRSRELTRAVATVRTALRGRPNAPSGPMVSRFAVAPVPAPPAAPANTPPAPAPAAPAPATPVVEAVNGTVTQVFTFTATAPAEPPAPGVFWEQYAAACAQEDRQLSPVDRARQETVLRARVAALTQVLAPEAPALRLGLVKYLAAVSHAEATRALARLAVFSEEDEVRLAAVEALKVRRERDYTDTLLASLRYPWPAVARRGADAIARLERTDLAPRLVEVLDEPDPRAPVAKAAGGRPVFEARELVRVNHHRSCLLCHAPGNTAGVSPETLTAAVPVPSDPLPSPSDGYQTTSPDLSVRIDVTYLRPDFSAMQAVADAHPWPEMQRFDFLVRTRALTEDEAAACREKVASDDPGRPSPYHRAALAALRELTGRDAAPTAEAWRRLLDLPAPARPSAPSP